ncbi:M23 family metallopeptidase [Nocardioides sp. 31GB23]|uniref:M23 family metallopeptidase n=1 Tax=Nocardioides sp. 31GB23 TaxID=3156065 RepID=UPI0032B01D5A
MPVLVGVAALAGSVAGVLTTADTPPSEPAVAAVPPSKVSPASALNGLLDQDSIILGRDAVVSRDSSRDVPEGAAGDKFAARVEQQARQRKTKLSNLAAAAEKHARVLEKNLWQLPLVGYRQTAQFGETGLWATYHTGLDLAAPSGTPLVAIANATVTSAGYDGAYGNKTVLTLEDGTELWYAHQTSITVSAGESVTAGQTIGTVGSTGNVTGPHLHLEVRPGGGDPVDPRAALIARGVTP